jgi:hypothetical protein
MNWKFIKAYAFVTCFIVMLIAVFTFTMTHAVTYNSFRSGDCLPGYDELYFGSGAYACQRSDGFTSN